MSEKLLRGTIPVPVPCPDLKVLKPDLKELRADLSFVWGMS